MDSLDRRTLGRNIRQARHRLGLTQEQMAERINMTPEVYGRMERGNLVPRLERFVVICRVLGETPNRLISSREPATADEETSEAPDPAEVPIEDLQRRLGANMREARKRLGLTQVEMAERIRMPVDLYGRMERGETLPRLDRFVTICQVLGEMSDQLLGLAPPTADKPR
ncbi:helix-turn-helix domain-containing protein [Stigmatella aurantiaca]|uniref:Transcriptional regulator n=2 Tax=Stigmatella aurantiaca TaxID=41 RepID=Q08T87_STIAD|nr:helix-turn-helix transcriptional regulator [Stigmatella aurantiaca]ADO68772.1 Transcriptional regulator [Stigmatella aurantiaca DW4/3-1]EAU63709.1 transcriptional regulator [Stigmatella aurantiaca DW4/3-1]